MEAFEQRAEADRAESRQRMEVFENKMEAFESKAEADRAEIRAIREDTRRMLQALPLFNT